MGQIFGYEGRIHEGGLLLGRRFRRGLDGWWNMGGMTTPIIPGFSGENQRRSKCRKLNRDFPI